MVFEIRTIYDKEDIEGLSKAYYYTKRPIHLLNKVTSWLCFGVGILLLLFSLLFLTTLPRVIAQTMMATDNKYSATYVWVSISMTFAFFAGGLSMLLKSGKPIATKFSWRLFKQKGEEFRFRFDSFHIQFERPNVRSEIEYNCLQWLLEDKRCFYLFDSPTTAFILPKRDFLQGSPDDFRDFISRTTGKTIEWMK